MLVFFWDKPLTIVDENHYQAIAENILKHHIFALETGQPTAIRPPLYPAFLTVIYFLSGGIYFNAVRCIQILLSLLTVMMIFFLGRRMFNEKIGLLAAFIMGVYPSFLFFTHFLLTEVLFTFLLTLFVWFFLCFLDHKKLRTIFLSGLLLGLCALTRSILYPFILVTLLFIMFACHGSIPNRLKWLLLFCVGYALVVCPWTLRNTQLFNKVVIVNTMGGLNFYLGNYEYTPLNHAWKAILFKDERAFYTGHEDTLRGMNEAEREGWAVQMAKEFIINHKWLTFKRAVVKAMSFWGMERSVIGCITNEHFPNLNKKALLIIITPLIFLSYAFVIVTSLFGLVYNFRFKNFYLIFILLLIAHFTGLHSIVFGHSRYHLPLISLLVVFASWTLLNLKRIWSNMSMWRFRFSILLVSVFIMIWTREIVLVEGARFMENIIN